MVRVQLPAFAGLADPVDEAQSGCALAALGEGFVDLIGGALQLADSIGGCEVAGVAGALFGGRVVGGEDWAGGAVSAGDEVLGRALGAHSAEEGEARDALAGGAVRVVG